MSAAGKILRMRMPTTQAEREAEEKHWQAFLVESKEHESRIASMNRAARFGAIVAAVIVCLVVLICVLHSHSQAAAPAPATKAPPSIQGIAESPSFR